MGSAMAINLAGAVFLDAPVSGGPTGAREASLSIMADGDAAGHDEEDISALFRTKQSMFEAAHKPR